MSDSVLFENERAILRDKGVYIYKDQIVPRVYLGDMDAAKSVEDLKHAGITHMFTFIGEPELSQLPTHSFIKHTRFVIQDEETADMSINFIPAVLMIEMALRENSTHKVLIHCRAGQSRSAIICAAYLCYSENITPEKAIEKICEKRSVDPINKFRHQLNEFYNNITSWRRELSFVNLYANFSIILGYLA